MHLDQVHYLPDDVLVKTDRASMLVSLEIRTAFLHAGLAELAGSLDTSMHLGGRRQGARARDAAGRHLSRRAASGATARRPSGCRPPSGCAARWRRVLQRQLERGSIYSEGYFDRGAAERLVREHAASTHDHSDQLWPLLSLGLWADRFHGIDGALSLAAGRAAAAADPHAGLPAGAGRHPGRRPSPRRRARRARDARWSRRTRPARSASTRRAGVPVHRVRGGERVRGGAQRAAQRGGARARAALSPAR